MLKKLKCLEAQIAQTATSGSGNSNNSGLPSHVKIIKTEPIDFEMLHMEEKQNRDRRLSRDAEGNCNKGAATQRYQHVQIQTVPPRPAGGGGISLASSSQKVILTPRVEYVQRAGSTAAGTTIKQIYTQHVAEPQLQQQQHQIVRNRVNSRETPLHDAGTTTTILSAGTPQIIITRTLPLSQQQQQQQQQQHVSRRLLGNQSSATQYQRISLSSGSATNSPPPLQPQAQHQQRQQTPPPLSMQQQQQLQQQQQQHVRVIRDGRLYEETTSGLTRRHSVSPPPLHHHSRSAPVSPATVALNGGLTRRYSVSPHHEHYVLNDNGNGKQHVALTQYRQMPQSPPPPPPPPPPPSATIQTDNNNVGQNYITSTPAARKYVVTTTRHVNVISTNAASQQQQQQQQQHHYSSSPHYQHVSHAASSSNNTSSTSNACSNQQQQQQQHVFRTPPVVSSSSNNNNYNSSTAMRPPPPPPPPKIKNSSPPMSVGQMVNASSSSASSSSASSSSMGSMSNNNSNGLNGHCEEPSSSIPDLEFDGTTVLCRVCGDKASGFHYGVHSCEGCKGFFRRSIQQKIQYRPCTKNQQCSILRINRNRCQYCRLKKCIAVGMSRDAVRFGRVPKREKARILAAMQQSTQNRGQQRALATELDDQPRLLAAVLRAHLDTCEFTKEKVAAMRQRARECPSYSMPTLLACPLNPAPELQSEQEFSQRFAHVIRGVIDFAGMIPGFQLLTQDDKFTLLKAGLFDALFVRLICMFDSSINSIICLNGQVMRRDAIQNGANARFLVDSTFNFAERMNSMNLSDAEIGLFCAIVLITPDRPGLRNIELIEKMYSRLKGCLQTIINQNRPDQPEFLSKLLETMPDLRTLSTLHTEKLVVFRTEHKELLRQQMWSMDDDQNGSAKSPGASSWDESRMEVEAKSPLGSVSSTESGDMDYTTSSTTGSTATHHAAHQQPSALASSAPLLAATLSGGCPLRNRANSGSSGDSGAGDLDIVGSHSHLTQNGLTITPIVRSHSSASLHHQQLHHHLSVTGAAQHRYRKLDSPTDSGIESGNEKNECGGNNGGGSKTVSSGGSSSCSSPRSSVDDALDCSEANNHHQHQVTVSVSPVRSPQPGAPSSTSTLKRQIVEDMPVLKRVLQAPPLYDTNSLMDEAYKPHKKFRALRHRDYECTEADASSSTNGNAPASSPVQSSAAHSPPPANNSNASLMIPQAAASPNANATSPHPASNAIVSHAQAGPHHQSQLHMHLTRPSAQQQHQQPPQQQSSSLLSSTHSVLAKSLMAEPRMTPEQMKRSDIIQNYIMRDQHSASSTTPNGAGSRSPAPAASQHYAVHYATNSCSPAPSSSNSNCASPSTTTVTLASPPPPSVNRWSGHSVITTTTQRQQSVSPHSNGSSSNSSCNSSSATSSSSGGACQYFQSPHSTSASVSPPRPSPSAMHSPPRMLELQVDIADSQQPLNLSKKSPTPPPSKLQALVAAASVAQRYPTVSADVTVTATTAVQPAASASPPSSSSSANSPAQSQMHKVMLEA